MNKHHGNHPVEYKQPEQKEETGESLFSSLLGQPAKLAEPFIQTQVVPPKPRGRHFILCGCGDRDCLGSRWEDE